MKAILLFQDRKPWIGDEPKDNDGRNFYDWVILGRAEGVAWTASENQRFRSIIIDCESLVTGAAQAREHETPSDAFVACLPVYGRFE